jgi:two-component system chemotaxis sensor kinase CheA
MAIPLSAVARLEEFPESAVEHAGATEVIRYRGSILPLVQAPGRFGNTASSGGESRASMQVIVVQCDGRSAGLVVEAVRDVVRDSGSAERGRTGIDGTESVVLQDLVTDLIDVDTILRDVAPGGTTHRSGSSRSLQPALETSHE